MSENLTAAPSLAPGVYERLRAIAAGFLSRERPDHTLQPTALAHEAYARVVKSGRLAGAEPEEALTLISGAMRRVLVDHARRRRAVKRGGGGTRVPLDTVVERYETSAGDLMELDSALRELETRESGLARIVELRFFGGLTEDETAAQLGVTPRTVRRGWAFARVWLAQRLGGSGGDE
ncbi:MAG: ECF-type sigma factor [Phycisphaerales bacterium]